MRLAGALSLAALASMAFPAMAQVSVTGDGAAMPDLTACLSDVENEDTAAIDACVRANVDEIEEILQVHPVPQDNTSDASCTRAAPSEEDSE